jgi:hypothetical protein
VKLYAVDVNTVQVTEEGGHSPSWPNGLVFIIIIIIIITKPHAQKSHIGPNTSTRAQVMYQREMHCNWFDNAVFSYRGAEIAWMMRCSKRVFRFLRFFLKIFRGFFSVFKFFSKVGGTSVSAACANCGRWPARRGRD